MLTGCILTSCESMMPMSQSADVIEAARHDGQHAPDSAQREQWSPWAFSWPDSPWTPSDPSSPTETHSAQAAERSNSHNRVRAF